MSKFPAKSNSFSFSGDGIRIDFFTFTDPKVFKKLTDHGIDDEELDELISDMNEIFSETGGIIDKCQLEFDDGSTISITEDLCSNIASIESPRTFKYLLIRTELLRGIFDAWNLDGANLNPTDISIEKEIIKLPGADQISLVHVMHQDEYGEDSDYYGIEVVYQVFTAKGECYSVAINS